MKTTCLPACFVLLFSLFISGDKSQIFAAILSIVWDPRMLENTFANVAEFEPYSFKPMRDFSDSEGENTTDGQKELARRESTS